MSKSIYEEAVETLNKYRNQNYNSTDEDEVELANAINVILPKYVKQEKLLKLYQELDKINGWLLLCFTIGGEEIEKDYSQLGGGNRRQELIKQIKELEDE